MFGLALALAFLATDPRTGLSRSSMSPAPALVRTNRTPVVLLNTQIIIKPPLLNTNWKSATLQWSSNLTAWTDVPTNAITVSNPYVWVVYSSNLLTHTVTPLSTNYASNCWTISVTGGRRFFRWRGR